jgi:Transposase IS200 like
MARGNGRQDIVRDDVDRNRLEEHVGKAPIRHGWRVYAFAVMPNHLHIVLKTRQPNLTWAMQAFCPSDHLGFQRLVGRSTADAVFRSCARFRTDFQKSSSDKPSPSWILCLERLSIA